MSFAAALAARLRRRLAADLVPLLVLFGGLALGAFDPGGVIGDLRLKVFDQYQRIAPRPYAEAPVRYVDIDEASLAREGQWPWPRTVLARLVDTLAAKGAAAIVFDVVFAEPDRTSPTRFLESIGGPKAFPRLADAMADLPDNDRTFAASVAKAPVVTGFVLTADPNGGTPAAKAGFSRLGDDPILFVPRFAGAATTLPGIEKAAKGNGSFNLDPDRDGIVRNVPLVVARGDTLYPSLVAEALRVAQGAGSIAIKSSGANREQGFGAKTGITAIRIGKLTIPTSARGSVLIHYTPRVPGRAISAADVLDGKVADDQIAGRIVYVGTSAAGLLDLRASPLDPAMPGVEAHVQATEQIMLGHFLVRPDWARGAELAFTALGGLILLVALRRVGAAWAAVLAIAATGSAIAASWHFFLDARMLTDPISPSIVVAGVYVSGSLIQFLRTEGERNRVRSAFGQYLSPALVERLARQPELLTLGGETREMTFMFSDVRGFTTISERFKSNPEGLTRLINRFLTPMTDAILARQGTIDKYMGDCVMAFWNAPLDDDRHIQNACASSLAMIAALAELNQRLAAEEGPDHVPLNIGIGINTGNCVVGNMGSEQRFDYSVLGDAVNLASRLEGQSKTYGVTVVLGEETARVAEGEFALLELDLIAVKGKAEAVAIFALLGDAAMRATPAFAELKSRHDSMLAAYRGRDWAGATALLARCRDADPEGAMAGFHDLMEGRIAAFVADPPPEDWDGVYVATSK